MAPDLARIEAALAAAGLTPRGAFHPEADDGVPTLAGGAAAATVVLAGNAGPGMWAAFAAARTQPGAANPLDEWTHRVLEGVAADLGATALFPFGGPPYLPFQRWAMRA
ncbi:MAG: ferredoxin, partial [Alphaproteobacteria bacterium]